LGVRELRESSTPIREDDTGATMGRRERQRRRAADGAGAAPSATSYADDEGNVLTLRDQLSLGTLEKLQALDARPAASGEDRWQRRLEYLFERLAVRWEIADLPLEDQKELLGRYRMASPEERRRVGKTIAEHMRARYPGVEL